MCKPPKPPNSVPNAGGACNGGTTPCATCKLVSITVIQNATQTNLTVAKNWAAVKKSSDDVIVQAKTDPNTPECWNKINWSGDSGAAVPGHPNQRSLSRGTSKKYHVQADLGGVSDSVDVWVVWATITYLNTGMTPANSAKFRALYDGTEKLGAQSFDGGNSAAGKIAPVATIAPAGIHSVITGGWGFRREKMRRDFLDGAKIPSRWDTTWQDDTSMPAYLRLTPDPNDKIYDLDGPNITDVGSDSLERYDNFRQWVEWNGEMCSDKAGWYFKARWKKDKNPQVTLKEVGAGQISPVPGDGDHFY